MVVDAPQVLLSLETWKSVEGAVTVILPGAPVRFAPDKLYDCDAEFEPTKIFPKSVIVPVTVNEGDMAPQAKIAVALLRGAGAATVKSAPLLSVSVQPLLPRKPASTVLSAGQAAAPSKQVAVPYPTKSI